MRAWLVVLGVSLSGCLGAGVDDGASGPQQVDRSEDRWVTFDCSILVSTEVGVVSFTDGGCDLREMGVGSMWDYQALEVTLAWSGMPPTVLAVHGSLQVDDCQTENTVCNVASETAEPGAGSMTLSVGRSVMERYASAGWSVQADVDGAVQDARYDVTVRVLPS